MDITEGDGIGGRVMDGCQEPGIVGNCDPSGSQANPYIHIIEQRGGHPRVGLARVTSAGTTIQSRPIGVVPDVGRVPAQGHNSGKARYQAKVAEHSLGQVNPAAGIQASVILRMNVWPKLRNLGRRQTSGIGRNGRGFSMQ